MNLDTIYQKTVDTYNNAKQAIIDFVQPAPAYQFSMQTITGQQYSIPLEESVDNSYMHLFAKSKEKNGKGGGRLHNESQILRLGNKIVDKRDRQNGESVIELICRKLNCGKKAAQRFRKDARKNYYTKK